jgi:hypothetical protein
MDIINRQPVCQDLIKHPTTMSRNFVKSPIPRARAQSSPEFIEVHGLLGVMLLSVACYSIEKAASSSYKRSVQGTNNLLPSKPSVHPELACCYRLSWPLKSELGSCLEGGRIHPNRFAADTCLGAVGVKALPCRKSTNLALGCDITSTSGPCYCLLKKGVGGFGHRPCQYWVKLLRNRVKDQRFRCEGLPEGLPRRCGLRFRARKTHVLRGQGFRAQRRF